MLSREPRVSASTEHSVKAAYWEPFLIYSWWPRRDTISGRLSTTCNIGLSLRILLLFPWLSRPKMSCCRPTTSPSRKTNFCWPTSNPINWWSGHPNPSPALYFSPPQLSPRILPLRSSKTTPAARLLSCCFIFIHSPAEGSVCWALCLLLREAGRVPVFCWCLCRLCLWKWGDRCWLFCSGFYWHWAPYPLKLQIQRIFMFCFWRRPIWGWGRTAFCPWSSGWELPSPSSCRHPCPIFCPGIPWI